LFFAKSLTANSLYEKKHNIFGQFTLQTPVPGQRKPCNALPSQKNQEILTYFFLVQEFAKKIDLGGWL
jgi:hypothetical protein